MVELAEKVIFKPSSFFYNPVTDEFPLHRFMGREVEKRDWIRHNVKTEIGLEFIKFEVWTTVPTGKVLITKNTEIIVEKRESGDNIKH
ncbi:MAG: hypothetical protein DDT42_02012 [candidate division WS2 bacterium]|uniref:Uncharacterized protein n=1 Tax=Psychracetigena formicireducens TaxID=2986056 RepID=A0A9E2F783_PSYF1|nr:hypothetical protein [Candidatus Psychracetigena formicireducens]